MMSRPSSTSTSITTGRHHNSFLQLPTPPIAPRFELINVEIDGYQLCRLNDHPSIEQANLTEQESSRVLRLRRGEIALLEVGDKKTSDALTQTLSGNTAPESGQIKVQGVDLSLLSERATRTSIGVIPSSPVMISGSVLDNIIFGSSAYSPLAVAAAANSATIGLPLSFPVLETADINVHTQANDNFKALGQELDLAHSRCIALATILLAKAQVVVLQDPFSDIAPSRVSAVAAAIKSLGPDRTIAILQTRTTDTTNESPISFDAVFSAIPVSRTGTTNLNRTACNKAHPMPSAISAARDRTPEQELFLERATVGAKEASDADQLRLRGLKNFLPVGEPCLSENLRASIVWHRHERTLFRATLPRSPDTEAAAITEIKRLRTLDTSIAHPSIPELVDSSTRPGQAFGLHKHLDGRPLTDTMLFDGPLPYAQVAALGVSIADALAYLHQNGYGYKAINGAGIVSRRSWVGLRRVEDIRPLQTGSVARQISDLGLLLHELACGPSRSSNAEPCDHKRLVDLLPITSDTFSQTIEQILAGDFSEQAAASDVSALLAKCVESSALHKTNL